VFRVQWGRSHEREGIFPESRSAGNP